MVAGGVDVLKKLAGEAKQRQQKQQHPGAAATPAAAQQPTAVSPGAQAQSASSTGAPPAGHRFFVSSNWKSLLEKRPSVAPKTAEKKDTASIDDGGAGVAIVALDCEMVGVGPGGDRSVLARVSLVDHEGRVLLDKLVKPREEVTDYRTHVTGITAATLRGKEVITDDVARRKAADILTGKVVVGHALQHDFQALLLSHPHTHIRDTSLFRPFRPPGQEKKTPSLKRLAAHWLHEEVQTGKHDSVEDAQIALRLYRMKSRIWEKQMRSAMRPSAAAAVSAAAATSSSRGAAAQDDEDEGEAVQRPAQAAGAEGKRQKKTRAKAAKRAAAAAPTQNPGKKKRQAAARMAADAGAVAADAAAAAIPSAKKRRKEV